MKICYVADKIEGLHEGTGGAGQGARRVLDLISNNKQLQIHAVTLPAVKTAILGKNVYLHSISNIDAYTGNLLGNIIRIILPFDWQVYRQFINILDTIKPECIHAHRINDLSLAIIYAARKKHIPLILSIYDYWLFCPTAMLWKEDKRVCYNFKGNNCFSCLKNRKLGLMQYLCSIFRQMIFSYFIAKIDEFIVLSESSRKILESYGIPGNKIDNIRLPLEYKENKYPIKNTNTLVYVGWLQPHKGVHILLKAMKNIVKKKPDTKLRIIGSYSENKKYYQKICSLISGYGLNTNITIEGEKKSSDIHSILSESDIVVIPEQWENMSPLILTEAMAAAKPIVASKVGGLPELIEDGKSGLLVDRKDIRNFENKILWLLRNRKKADKMGIEAKKRFLKLFSSKNIFNRLMKTYQSVCLK